MKSNPISIGNPTYLEEKYSDNINDIIELNNKILIKLNKTNIKFY